MKIINLFNIRKILSFFGKQNGSPYYNAKGIAVGVFSGCFPFFGFQTLIGIFLAKLIKGNLLLATACTWISNPFTYIPLYFFNYKVGSFLLKNSPDIIFDKDLIIEELLKKGSVFSSRLILGSALVGLLLASISGVIVFFLYKRKMKKSVF